MNWLDARGSDLASDKYDLAPDEYNSASSASILYLCLALCSSLRVSNVFLYLFKFFSFCVLLLGILFCYSDVMVEPASEIVNTLLK